MTCATSISVASMKVTHLGHACLLIDYPGTRILIDPGTFSSFDDVEGLDAILVTHQHPDHLDPDRIEALIARNPDAVLRTDPQSAEVLTKAGVEVIVNAAGQRFTLGDVVVTPVGGQHAEIHPYIPRIANVGLLLSAEGHPTLFHPGDALEGQPLENVDLLAVPVNAPWAAVKETIAFVRRIAPSAVIPIHDALLSDIGRAGYLRHIADYGIDGGVPVRDLRGEPATELR